MDREFLLCTNGNESTWPSIEYGAWAAISLEAPVTLLGISEGAPDAPPEDRVALEATFDRASRLFREKGIRFTIQRENGTAEQVVSREANRKDCIVVLGPLGRAPLRRFLVGRSIRMLLEEITAPVLYVPEARLPLKKMLICLGGLGYELTAEHLGVRMSQVNHAEVTLLHVAPPVNLDYPTARAEREQWRNIADTDTLVGRNLRSALEEVRTAGLTSVFIARQGDIVEEILTEVKEGNYDLVCMGSPYSSRGIRHLYEPNITDEVAEHSRCPVLTARYSILESAGPKP